ncbi:MAG: hypothetical protein ACLTCV_11520 [Oscillospiraceae bacterium]
MKRRFFGIFGMHGSAAGFLYGLLFCSGWSLDSIILADHAVKSAAPQKIP